MNEGKGDEREMEKESKLKRTGMSHHESPRFKTDQWLTPPEILKALGEFDIDPCACKLPRPWPTAKIHYSTNGLSVPWVGRVWLNPPYGPYTGVWLKKLADHSNGIALIFARTETKFFFQYVWEKADALLFFKGRLHFHYPSGEKAQGNAGAPSVLIAYGMNNVEILRNCGIDGKFISINNKGE